MSLPVNIIKSAILCKVYVNGRAEQGEYIKGLEDYADSQKEIIVPNGKHFMMGDNRDMSYDSRYIGTIGKEAIVAKFKTKPYSPWQNGKVERSHREDGKILYGRKLFISKKELIRQVQKHENRYNGTAKTSLNFKSPNQTVAEYFSKCNICLDS